MPRLVGHENLPRRFARYRDALGYQERTSEWQFGFEPGSLSGLFSELIDPTETYRERLELTDSDRRVVLLHAPAETDDATAVWLPRERILYGGGATIGGFPNIGSPLRTPRDPKRWAHTLDMYASLDPALLIREYGPEIEGVDAVHQLLETTAAVLRYLRAETLVRLNNGMRIEDIVHDVAVPEQMVDYPWLEQSYGCCEYVIRDTYRLETGWWNRRITDLHPARPSDAAAAILSAIADREAVLDRVRELHEADEHQLALHVVDLLAEADGEERHLEEARALKREVLLALAEASEVYQSENFYRTAAAALVV